jgi:AAA+ superfamily predicted ATPase
MPEAFGLAEWLAQRCSTFGLSDRDVPSSSIFIGSRRYGVPTQDWRKVGTALAKAEACRPTGRNVLTDRWTTAIADQLALDPLDARILALALHYHVDEPVQRLFEAISECRGDHAGFHRDTHLIALLLRSSPEAIAARLTGEARLMAAGLLQHLRVGRLSVLRSLPSLICNEVLPEADIYDQLLGTIAGEPLPWDAFTHLGREAEVAATVLTAALAGRESGVNILLYGPPGTGKTSFAATLAARVGVRLRPITETNEDGNEPGRSERLAGLLLAQRLATPGETLLLFDEAEDLFTSRNNDPDKPVINSRVFINRVLERTAVPVIWTANNIGVLGPAVVRRMTMCLELRVPNLATRTYLWRQMGEAEGVVLAEADAARLARLVPAAPAVASAALRATRLAGGGAETARLIVEGVARAVAGGLPAPEPEQDATYDPALVNADCDLAALTTDLLREGVPRAVSFLLSGPPGAGKSAWVRYLAGRMGMPVLHKRASDLLNPYVGGTERNIADAFAEARDTLAFLVFDEADSLLLDRADAVRSWEISQVNEMLTWMESHTLPFACTTNLAERLDRASLRRFLVKLRFDWLTQTQARLAFRRFFGLVAPAGLDGLRTLTPADFSLVRRRAVVRGAQSESATLLRLLAAECEGRVGGRLQVGFATGAPGDCDVA